jgi:antitoxin PrlF
MTTATITSKGQVTIPKEIRDSLLLHTGDKIDFTLTAQGQVVLKPVTQRVDDLFGRLRKPGQKTLSTQEMDAAIKKRARSENR